MRILQNQGPADSFIYWMEDNYVPQALNKRETAVKRCGFTDEPSEGAVAWAQNGELVINSPRTVQHAAQPTLAARQTQLAQLHRGCLGRTGLQG